MHEKTYDFEIANCLGLPTHCVEITEIYSHIFWQKFRESNVFIKEIACIAK